MLSGADEHESREKVDVNAELLKLWKITLRIFAVSHAKYVKEGAASARLMFLMNVCLATYWVPLGILFQTVALGHLEPAQLAENDFASQFFFL